VPSRTQSAVGLVETGLRSRVDVDDRSVLLFGDTWPDAGLGDSLGWVTESDVWDVLHLTFVSDPVPGVGPICGPQ
jgi:hypothetical protein